MYGVHLDHKTKTEHQRDAIDTQRQLLVYGGNNVSKRSEGRPLVYKIFFVVVIHKFEFNNFRFMVS